MRFNGVPKQFRRSIQREYQPLNGSIVTVFHGPPYRGKTHNACNAVYQCLQMSTKSTALFVTGEGLLQEVHTAIKKDQSALTVMRPYYVADYVVLDDFLATNRQWVSPGVEKISELIRTRLDNHRKTIITTNLTLDQMFREKLESRITSRISRAKWIEFDREPNPNDLGEYWDLDLDSWHHEVTELHNLCVAQDRLYCPIRSFKIFDILKSLPKPAWRDVAKFNPLLKNHIHALLRDNESGI